MATAGSGDVLTGIIAGLRAQKYDAMRHPTPGVYLHGLAGITLKRNIPKKSLVATDIIENISESIQIYTIEKSYSQIINYPKFL